MGVFMVVDPQPACVSPCLVLVIEGTLSAGFPSPAADYVEGRIDLSVIWSIILN